MQQPRDPLSLGRDPTVEPQAPLEAVILQSLVCGLVVGCGLCGTRALGQALALSTSPTVFLCSDLLVQGAQLSG